MCRSYWELRLLENSFVQFEALKISGNRNFLFKRKNKPGGFFYNRFCSHALLLHMFTLCLSIMKPQSYNRIPVKLLILLRPSERLTQT